MEAFCLRGEKLYRVEKTLTETPYGMQAGLPEDPVVDLSGPGTELTLPSPCDRVCLENAVNGVLEALKSYDPLTLALAKDTRYSENGQLLAIGNGLWEPVAETAKPDTDEYAAVFADTEGVSARY